MSHSDSNGHPVDSVPKSISEAILRIIWPARKYPLGAFSIFGLICCAGFFSFTNNDTRTDIAKAVADWAYPASKVDAIVLIPSITSGFPTPVAVAQAAIRRKSPKLESISAMVSDGQAATGRAGLKYGYKFDFAFDRRPDNVIASLSVSNDRSEAIAQTNYTAALSDFEVSKAHLVDGLLNSLDINWHSLSPEHSNCKGNALAWALFFQAYDVRSVNPELAITLMKRAVIIDDHFAAGHGYLSDLLKGAGRMTESLESEATAKRCDAEYAHIDPSYNPTEALVRALSQAKWARLDSGLLLLTSYQTDYRIQIFAWKVNPQLFSFKIVRQTNELGEDAESFRGKARGLLAINAGRFKKDAADRLSGVGLMIIDNVVVNPPWPERKGGVLLFYENEAKIVPTYTGIPPDLTAVRYAIQATPLMIDPGGKWAMNANDFDRQNRSAVCITKDKQVIILAVSEGGVSLFELASIMRPQNEGNPFGCDSAIALDGGPSTQLSFPETNIAILGGWNVHDALVVTKKD